MPANTADLKKLKVAELKDQLSNRGLDTKGVKDELIARLAAAMETEGGAAPAEEQPANMEEPAVAEAAAEPAAGAAPAAAPVPATADGTAAPAAAPAADKPKPALTEVERRKLRAERFGEATAKGVKAPAGVAIAGLGHFDPAEEFARRKKRAERFGLPVPESKAEEVAKKKARADRFGIEIPMTAAEIEAKKKARADRFAATGGAAPGSAAAKSKEEEETEKKKIEDRKKRFSGAK